MNLTCSKTRRKGHYLKNKGGQCFEVSLVRSTRIQIKKGFERWSEEFEFYIDTLTRSLPGILGREVLLHDKSLSFFFLMSFLYMIYNLVQLNQVSDIQLRLSMSCLPNRDILQRKINSPWPGIQNDPTKIKESRRWEGSSKRSLKAFFGGSLEGWGWENKWILKILPYWDAVTHFAWGNSWNLDNILLNRNMQWD